MKSNKSSKSSRSLGSIPPTRAWLEQHVKRTVFQEGYVWGQTPFVRKCFHNSVLFSKNNYNEDFIQWNTHRPTTTTKANNNATPMTTETIPYIKGISENISHILQPFNIRIAHKPITTLHQLLTIVKDKDEPRNRQGAVYKINCSDCHTSYISETGRNHNINITNEPNRTT